MFLYFILGNRTFCSNNTKFVIFSQKKAFLIFGETETPKKKIPAISGNANFLYFRKRKP